MRRATTMLTAATLAGCALPAAEPPTAASARRCDAQAAASFVGKRADRETIDQARQAAGADAARAIRPGEMVTMDYREDRLNLDLDADGVIRGVRCG